MDEEELKPIEMRPEGGNRSRMLETTQGEPSRLDSDFFNWLQSLLFTMTFAVLFAFVGGLTRVSGASMDPTLHDGEMLLIWSLGYEAKQGDVVIVNKPTVEYLQGQSIVKRVIALGGQTVLVDYENNQVLVDGVAIDEPYILETMHLVYGSENPEEVLVPEGSVYVLGDNRNNSSDSRLDKIGTIDEGYILGKAVCGIFPVSSWRMIE